MRRPEEEAKPVVSVLEIERFALHDGPGIRTVVFLQGCPLFCPWCANPESQGSSKQLMYNERKCVRCHICIKQCSQQAIHLNEHNRLVFDRSLCGNCRLCGELCPQQAIHFPGVNMEIAAVLATVEKDRAYYEDSQGGVTLSGGEPFTRYDGFLTLLKALKAGRLHVAVETTGQTGLTKLMEAEPYIDLFLFDIKHVNDEILKATTGAELGVILNNLAYLAKKNPQKIIIRTPVIPGFNYEVDVLEGIFDLAVRYRIKEVHLLPYHTLGRNKYEQLGRVYAYSLATVNMLAPSELAPYVASGAAKGLRVMIGG